MTMCAHPLNSMLGATLRLILPTHCNHITSTLHASRVCLSTAAWGALPMAERIAWVTKIADALEAMQSQIGELESLDTGKPVALATAVDANRSVRNFRFFAEFVCPSPSRNQLTFVCALLGDALSTPLTISFSCAPGSS